MALVKLEINGKRVIADNSRTILQVARDNGICDIPTLCHDEQLEPFASCFLCVVKVKGARTLVPACSTKVAAGMVVETDTPEVRRSRKAALELLGVPVGPPRRPIRPLNDAQRQRLRAVLRQVGKDV